MGIDMEDSDETSKGKSKQQILEQQQRHQWAQDQIQLELDLSYYYLCNKGFSAILPQLEEEHFSKIKRLSIAGNALNDQAIIELCLSLKQLHCQTIESLDISDNKLTDESVLALLDFLTRNSSLKEVVIDDLPEVSQVSKTRLAAALKKNQMGLPSVDLMLSTAKQVDQALNKQLKFI